MTGTITGISNDFKTGKPCITVTLNEKNEAIAVYEALKDIDKLTITLKKHREKRSLDANAYFWVLVDRLSEKLNLPKSEIYRSYIKEIGGNAYVGCFREKDIDGVCKDWEERGLGWVTDVMDSKIDGCITVIMYFGSSEYDTAQMSRLIGLAVADCIENGIETKTPEELSILLEEWGTVLLCPERVKSLTGGV